MVATSRTVGKALNSSGFWMNSTVMRISTENAKDSVRLISRMVTIASASAISPLKRERNGPEAVFALLLDRSDIRF